VSVALGASAVPGYCTAAGNVYVGRSAANGANTDAAFYIYFN
jgi:hypothetical protein